MKKIKLTQGQFALVDDADYDDLNQYKWYALKEHDGNFYAARMSSRREGNRFVIRMSRQILRLKFGDRRQADHRNHNTLDNRRGNLRVCTHQENQRNQKHQKRKTSSQFKGVCWCKRRKKWQTQIYINKKVKFLGYFETEEEAALAYNEGAKKYHGEFAHLNVIF